MNTQLGSDFQIFRMLISYGTHINTNMGISKVCTDKLSAEIPSDFIHEQTQIGQDFRMQATQN